MSQQGDDRRRHENDWWGELYDPARADAGPAAAADSVDDRFDSATRTLGRGRPGGGDQMPAAGAPWGPAEGEPGGAAPGPDGVAGGGPQGWRPPEGGDGPGATPPPSAPAPRRPWHAAASGFVGDGPPVYEPEPTTLPVADPEELGDLVSDTVLDGARYGSFTLRAVSLRGDAARSRGEPRRDTLLTARFGTGDGALVLVAVASGTHTPASAPDAARELCDWIGTAVGRSHARLVEDIRAARRGALKSGLHRLTDRGYGRLRSRATELGLDPAAYTAPVRCLLLSAHPDCRVRVFFGVGDGGLFRLRDGAWQDLEPDAREGDTVGGPVLAFGDGRPSAPELPADWEAARRDPQDGTPHDGTLHAAASPPADPFRFRASVARPGDTLLLCGTGLAEPLRAAPALAAHWAERWAGAEPPGLAGFLADAQVGVKGYADDRTAAAVWEA